MLDWIERHGRKKEFLLFWCVMMAISLAVSFYVNFKLNHMTIGGHVYAVAEIGDDFWRFRSNTGDDIVITNKEDRKIIWQIDDLTMRIGDDAYHVYRALDRNLVMRHYIDLNGDKVNVSRAVKLIGAKGDPVLPLLIAFFAFINALVCFNLVYPELVWKLRMLFISRGGEPTEFYLGATRIVSLLLWIVITIRIVMFV